MRVGTKTILFGLHSFWLHPMVVWYSYFKIYGSLSFKMAAAIFFHDLGYWRCKSLKHGDGYSHPSKSAELFSKFFKNDYHQYYQIYHHSRRYPSGNTEVSCLGIADKLSFFYYPKWLVLFLGTLSGELKEYLNNFKNNNTHLKYVQLFSKREIFNLWYLNCLESNFKILRSRISPKILYACRKKINQYYYLTTKGN